MWSEILKEWQGEITANLRNLLIIFVYFAVNFIILPRKPELTLQDYFRFKKIVNSSNK